MLALSSLAEGSYPKPKETHACNQLKTKPSQIWWHSPINPVVKTLRRGDWSRTAWYTQQTLLQKNSKPTVLPSKHPSRWTIAGKGRTVRQALWKSKYHRTGEHAQLYGSCTRPSVYTAKSKESRALGMATEKSCLGNPPQIIN